MKQFQEDFFNKPKDVAVAEFKRRVDTFLGPNNVGTKHIEELHDLGYLPIRIKALPEGTLCPIRVPALIFINTHPDFFWLTNYFETLISTTLWLPMTSATTARLYKKELIRHARKTGFKDVDLNFLIHDFSMRGMAGVEAATMSGMGHMTSFCGSETIPAIAGLEEYYNANAEKELIAATIPATEHSVMCAGGKEDELETFKRLITEVYPQGFVSIVSDTWDFWQVMTNYLPRLKDTILARDGRVVIRPDSGDPVDIICGVNPANCIEVDGKHYYFKDYGMSDWVEDVVVDGIKTYPEKYEQYLVTEAQLKGAYKILWDIFGGTVNEKGYKVLDAHIGMIYGDSITLERQKEIYRRLEEKGFAATNLVLGVGSFTYQYKSRDSLGFAMKATWCQVNGEGREIFKDPMPDFEGYLRVYPDKGALQRYGGDPNSDVICSKVRDPKTGQLSGFKIENPEVIEKNVNLPFVVIDDLCDGGGTFKGIAQLLGFHYPDRERTIYVTHMVNPKGITTLSENYKEVYFTNSYKDWNNEILPNNVKVIEIV
jgi:nicotinamide phosphoribosyltransferase